MSSIRKPYILPDGTAISGRWYERPERFVASVYGWRVLTKWAKLNIVHCAKGLHAGVELHHVYGRGGGKRDDRLFVNNKPNLQWLCRMHHDMTPILRREPISQEITT